MEGNRLPLWIYAIITTLGGLIGLGTIFLMIRYRLKGIIAGLIILTGAIAFLNWKFGNTWYH